MLLHKNQQEYQETMNCWKQEVSLTFAFLGWIVVKAVVAIREGIRLLR